MGLMVHSLSEFPVNAERNYYLYVLRGSWDSDIEKALRNNLLAMSDAASRSNSAVIFGTEGKHFQNEVFSWHKINGEEAETLLPAILITTIHQNKFIDENDPFWRTNSPKNFMILIPLREVIDSGNNVVDVMRKIFADIRSNKELSEFEVSKKLNRGRFGTFMDGIQLKPSFMGIGFDLKNIPKILKGN